MIDYLEPSVASAVVACVLRKEELPAELGRHIAELIEFTNAICLQREHCANYGPAVDTQAASDTPCFPCGPWLETFSVRPRFSVPLGSASARETRVGVIRGYVVRGTRRSAGRLSLIHI